MVAFTATTRKESASGSMIFSVHEPTYLRGLHLLIQGTDDDFLMEALSFDSGNERRRAATNTVLRSTS